MRNRQLIHSHSWELCLQRGCLFCCGCVLVFVCCSLGQCSLLFAEVFGATICHDLHPGAEVLESKSLSWTAVAPFLTLILPFAACL